jgi:membrane protein
MQNRDKSKKNPSSKLKNFFTNAWSMTKDAANSFGDDKATTFSAALAYYTIFAAAPLLLIAIAVGGIFFGKEASSGEIYGAVRGLLGPEGAKALQSMVEASALSGNSVLATVVGVGTLLLGATTVFGQLQESLNQIWKVQPKPGSSIRTLLRQRILSFSIVLVIAFLLLVSLVASAVLSGLQKFATDMLPGSEVLWQVVNLGVSFVMTSFLFAAIYKILPDVKLSWRDVWSGGLITAFFFGVGKYLIGLYIGQSAVASTFGAAGAIVIILVWTYYTSAVLLFGAEFTRLRTIRRARDIQPKEGAQWLKIEHSEENPFALPQPSTH